MVDGYAAAYHKWAANGCDMVSGVDIRVWIEEQEPVSRYLLRIFVSIL